MDHRVARRFVVADGESEGADGGAGVVLFVLRQQRPGEGYGAFEVVIQRFVTDGTVVARKLKHDVELRQQHDDEFSALLLLV